MSFTTENEWIVIPCDRRGVELTNSVVSQGARPLPDQLFMLGGEYHMILEVEDMDQDQMVKVTLDTIKEVKE
jgi:small ligand-binding sensory domain FIST